MHLLDRRLISAAIFDLTVSSGVNVAFKLTQPQVVCYSLRFLFLFLHLLSHPCPALFQTFIRQCMLTKNTFLFTGTALGSSCKEREKVRLIHTFTWETVLFATERLHWSSSGPLLKSTYHVLLYSILPSYILRSISLLSHLSRVVTHQESGFRICQSRVCFF